MQLPVGEPRRKLYKVCAIEIAESDPNNWPILWV